MHRLLNRPAPAFGVVVVDGPEQRGCAGSKSALKKAVYCNIRRLVYCSVYNCTMITSYGIQLSDTTLIVGPTHHLFRTALLAALHSALHSALHPPSLFHQRQRLADSGRKSGARASADAGGGANESEAEEAEKECSSAPAAGRCSEPRCERCLLPAGLGFFRFSDRLDAS